MHRFYYDESEHSRKINDKTIKSDNYYDNFVSVIVGWPKQKERAVFEKYQSFEAKYAKRKDKNGELKSKTLKKNQFEFGFASMTKPNVQFVDDFLSIFDEEINFYFSIASKIEYLVLQLFAEYKSNFFFDADAMKYSITKALVVYQPEKVITCLFNSPESFVDVLKDFFRERIECNKKYINLKSAESQAFSEILSYLENVSIIPKLDWVYDMPFDGFRKYLEEEKIADYFLTLDKEGDAEQDSKTLQAAHLMGLQNTTEVDSLSSCGVRMADMMAGIMTKLLKSLCDSLRYHSPEEGVQKKVLAARWFQMNEVQLELYKKLYKIICEWDHAWYKSYVGIYSDDLVTFIALLNYMNHFESVKQIHDEGLSMQGEYFNSFACKQLEDYFDRRRNKLPIEPITDTNKEFFINRRGAKVFFDIEKQPIFPINEGSQTAMVLSVGMSNMALPLITVLKDEKPVCYRLPQELSDWAYTVIGIANMGENLFPAQVTFSKINGRYYADIL